MSLEAFHYEPDMADFMDDENYFIAPAENELNEYDMLTKVTDTSAAQARRGKDIQGIPWDSLNITRESYRLTRLQQYKNYENVPSSGEAVDKECKQTQKSGNYYEFFHNTRLVKPTILHFQLRNLVWATSKHDVYLMSNYSVMHWSTVSSNLSEILNFAGHIAPNEVYKLLRYLIPLATITNPIFRAKGYTFSIAMELTYRTGKSSLKKILSKEIFSMFSVNGLSSKILYNKIWL
ncbi:hypothetical protein Patl1_26208 [Pistacia atlantica]|uniref:Uncharacterized protein n=1 Tax=Pistacia atlantica TaxID=434234 RepID=A0ACC1B192_9ROSI|nr:hypothetical protein Patl1_26208 [Pistacia atlantica]